MRTKLFSAASLSLLLLACGSAHDGSGNHGSETGGEADLEVTGSDGVGREKTQLVDSGWGSHGTQSRVQVSCSRSAGTAGKSVLHVTVATPVLEHSSYEEGLELEIRDFAGAGTYQAMGADGSLSAKVSAGISANKNALAPSELVELSLVAASSCTFVATSELEGTIKCSDLTETSIDLATGKGEALPSSIALKGTWSCDKLIDE
jgi:hypothetical protein